MVIIPTSFKHNVCVLLKKIARNLQKRIVILGCIIAIAIYINVYHMNISARRITYSSNTCI